MPSETSPSSSPRATPLSTSPDYTRISNERSRPAQGLNRMNQISATRLGRLSQDSAPGDMDLDQATSHDFPPSLRVPTSLRNNRFLNITLDMNLNSDSAVSLQEDSHASANDTDMVSAANQQAFSSESSDSDDDYLDADSNHDQDDDSADDNSADLEESDSYDPDLISNHDYDIYHGVRYPRVDATPMDNGTNYYNSFVNFNRDHGYGNFSLMSLESIRSTFPSSVAAPHRLLLSSARQNTTNQNTLVNMRPYESNHDFSLRRQNAIRVKRRKTAQKLAIMADALHEDFRGAFAAIRKGNPYSGKLPIFENHSCCTQPASYISGAAPSESCVSLRSKMGEFLRLRRGSKLWNTHPSSARRHKPATTSDLKRRRPYLTSSVAKRQRLMRSSCDGETSKDHVDLKLGEHINVSELSPQDKLNILDVLPCSFIKDGSAFAMKVVNTWAANSEPLSVNVTFSQVSLAEKFLHGCFDLRKRLEVSDEIYDITGFLSFLCGGPRSRYTINNANNLIQSKFSLMNDLLMTIIVDLGVTHPKIVSELSGTMQIPFSGEIIDFNKHDLRFLGERKARVPHLTRGVSTRIEDERAKLQINEWLNVKPFSDFSETFFMNYLYFTEQNLKKFSSIAPAEQHANLQFAENMKESIFYLSKDYPSVQNAKIPMIESKQRQTSKELRQRRRHEPRSNLRKSKFVKDWESKICEKLCDHITCGGTCLLNLQLNYMLFTVRVDISAEIDRVVSRFLGLVTSESEKQALQKKYNSLCKQKPSSEAKEAVFLCSLNRKTGSLEMHNTRSHLDFTYSNTTRSLDLPLGPARDSSDANAVEDYLGDSLFPARSSPYCEDPALMATPSILRGESRRGAAGSLSHGGGSAQFDFI